MMTSAIQTLTEYLQDLTKGEPATRPAPGETWKRTMRRIAVFGETAEVDEQTYWHFLEVLPPQWMDGDTFTFCFAEGMEPLRLFWRRGERYFCRRLTWEETHAFCDLAGLRRDYYFY